MKIISVIMIFLMSVRCIAGGMSEEIIIHSLIEGEVKYLFCYKSVSTNKEYSIELNYDATHYKFYARFLTKNKFQESLELLKSQFAESKPVRFGWFGSGPCKISGNKYRSDALDIYNEGTEETPNRVVYAFCGYR